MLSGVCADWSRSTDDNDTVLCARKTNLQHNNNTTLLHSTLSFNGSITRVHNKYMSMLSTYYILRVRALFCAAINLGDLKHLVVDYTQ